MGKKFAGKANVKTKKKPEKGFIILAAGVIVCILGLIAAIWWSVSRRSVGCLEISVNEEGELHIPFSDLTQDFTYINYSGP